MIWMCVIEDFDGMLELVDQLVEIPLRVETLSRVGNLPDFERGQAKLIWKCDLLGDLIFRQLDLTDGLGYEVGDMDHPSISFLTDRLLILREL